MSDCLEPSALTADHPWPCDCWLYHLTLTLRSVMFTSSSLHLLVTSTRRSSVAPEPDRPSTRCSDFSRGEWMLVEIRTHSIITVDVDGYGLECRCAECWWLPLQRFFTHLVDCLRRLALGSPVPTKDGSATYPPVTALLPCDHCRVTHCLDASSNLRYNSWRENRIIYSFDCKSLWRTCVVVGSNWLSCRWSRSDELGFGIGTCHLPDLGHQVCRSIIGFDPLQSIPGVAFFKAARSIV